MTPQDPAGSIDTSPAARFAAARKRQAAERTQLAQFRSTFDFPFDDFQNDACEALEAGRGVLVAAPTGAGKTVVGEFAVHLALHQGRKAFYTTPIKALSNQKFTDLARRYGAENVGLLTGDTSIHSEAPIVVMTTEVLRNMLYADSPALAGLGYVVMDEVHYLADRFRGPVWEEVIIHLPTEVQLVSLSATVSNAEEFGDWLAMVRGDTLVVVSERRPVPLWQHVLVHGAGTGPSRRGPGADLVDLYGEDVDPTAPGVNPPINPDLLAAFRSAPRTPAQGRRGDRGYRGRGGRRPRGPMATAVRQTPGRVTVIDALDHDGLLPAIYFVFSRAGCEGAVVSCVRAGIRLTTPAEEERIRRVIGERTASLPAEDLDVLGFWSWQESLTRGVAAHHAGLLPVFKETVEELFSQGLVKVVFATETLALGINMPARSVVLEKLVKWDGTTHVGVTPGEYTQLTGRAGRRGIDVEGHAVVVDHSGLDPVHLAGLASKRTYPLRSSFRPTYNMAVNLVEQVGITAAREVLETSFAQFQADRGVVGLARQIRNQAEVLAGYAAAMTCDRGDYPQYAALQRRISEREKELHRGNRAARRAEVVAVLERLRRGDVVEVPSGRRAGYVVVLDPGEGGGLDGPRPMVLTQERQVKRLTLADVPQGLRVVTRIRIPKAFNARIPGQRRDLASSLRNALSDRSIKPARLKGPRDPAEDAELTQLRAEMRRHPCHSCPDRADHARWADRWSSLKREHAALQRKVEGRTGSIARILDRICEVLVGFGYLARTPGEPAGLELTDDGRWLRRLYVENDLLLAECIRRGAWAELDPAGLAAAVSTLVYSGRRENAGDPSIPGGPSGQLAQALDETTRIWSEVDDLEQAHHLQATGRLDFGIVEAVHRWVRGRNLEVVLRGADIAAGDFVRWCKQLIDVLDQVAATAPQPALRRSAHQAIEGLRRGVVAYSSL